VKEGRPWGSPCVLQDLWEDPAKPCKVLPLTSSTFLVFFTMIEKQGGKTCIEFLLFIVIIDINIFMLIREIFEIGKEENIFNPCAIISEIQLS
jgi:hypothetical protein